MDSSKLSFTLQLAEIARYTYYYDCKTEGLSGYYHDVKRFKEVKEL